MPIYVDNLFSTAVTKVWPYKFACHLFGNDRHKLHDFAFSLGLQPRWFQNHPQHPHYDLTQGKRRQAIAKGAIELTDEQASNFLKTGFPIFNPDYEIDIDIRTQ